MKENANRQQPILEAVKSGDINKVRSFLDENPELIQAENENGETLIFLAAYHNHADLVRLLIDKGADADIGTKYGVFPFDVALDEEVSEMIYEHSEDKEYLQPIPLVFKAVFRKDEELLRQLLNSNSGLVFNEYGKYKSTPLHLAVEANQLKLIRLLLGHGADPNANRIWESFGRISLYGTPLHLVKSAEATRILIEGGADVNADGWMGAKPLHEASQNGLTQVVKLLLEHGADANAPRHSESSDSREETPLFFARNKEIAELLIANGADVEAINYNGETPLQWAVRNVRLDVTETLIRHGADVNAANSLHETPLHSIGGIGDDQDKIGHQEQIANLLIENGADIHAKDKNGWTPLHKAASRGDLGTLKVLIEKGALPYERTSSEETALDIARSRDQQEMVEYLSEYLRINPPPIEPFRFTELCLIPGGDDFIAIGRGGELARFSIDNFDSENPLARERTEYSSLHSLAVTPDGTEFLIVPRAADYAELRRCTDLSLIEKVYFDDAGYIGALAFSPNGQWLASAGSGRVCLMKWNEREIVSSSTGGERIYSLCFDSDSKRLASVHSFQGGGYLQVDEIKPNGDLNKLGEIDHSITATAPEDFVDTLVQVQFSSDDRYLVVFETSAIYDEYKSVGWRGNLVAYDLSTADVAWFAPVNKILTFDDLSLSEAGFGMGFFTKFLIYENAVYCGATLGKIIIFNLPDGFPLGRYELPNKEDAVTFLALDRQNHRLMAISENGELTLIELR